MSLKRTKFEDLNLSSSDLRNAYRLEKALRRVFRGVKGQLNDPAFKQELFRRAERILDHARYLGWLI
jgi:hypothetical protein